MVKNINKNHRSLSAMVTNPIQDIRKKVAQTISRYEMMNPGDLVVTGVSGGPDSVCLLDILHELSDELGVKLVVAHFDHGLRPVEDGDETEFVRTMALSMNLPFETEKGSLLEGQGCVSLEERARNARYAFLEKVRKRLRARKIAVGHNLNDQAETVIMRFLRGSGPSGLAGIPPTREGGIIRPLIEINREEVLSYLEARGLPYATDSSNLSPDYLRNRIRLELIPRLLDYQPRLIEHLGHLAQILREEDTYLDRIVGHWIEGEAGWVTDKEVSISVRSFKELPRPLRSRVTRQLLRTIKDDLRRIGLSHIQAVHDLASSAEPQGGLNLPDGIRIKKTYDNLVLSAEPDQAPPRFHVLLHGPGTFHLEAINRDISLQEIEGNAYRPGTESAWTVHLDAERIRYPLVLRNFQPGDRFIPLGMAGHKKIKDFFIDLKIPSEIRRAIPILTSENTPVWVCGYRIDDRFRVTPETKRIIKISID